MFSKILIANRGEIAVRIIRACKEMGIATVAVHSQADKESLHVSLADESVCIGKALPSESYLRQKDIITAALLTGGSGDPPWIWILAENADFARLCEKMGWCSSDPAQMSFRMGDKDAARRMMKEAGVPTVPGTDLLTSPEQAAKAAGMIGYPVLIKARAGGGGKGIRLVKGPDEMEKHFDRFRGGKERLWRQRRIYGKNICPR